MKKLLLLLTTLFVLGFSTICAASDGSLLDAEDQMIGKFFAAKEYKEVEAMMSADMKTSFTAEKFAAFKKDLGNIKDKALVVLQKYPGEDRVQYITEFVNGNFMRLIVAFEINGEKPLLHGIGLVPLQQEGEAKTTTGQTAPAK